MKIQDAYLAGAAASELKKAQHTEALPPAAKQAEESRAAAEADGVQLSELSGRLLKLASGESPERAARLERLAADLRAGRYPVDPMAVSRRLIDEALAKE